MFFLQHTKQLASCQYAGVSFLQAFLRHHGQHPDLQVRLRLLYGHQQLDSSLHPDRSGSSEESSCSRGKVSDSYLCCCICVGTPFDLVDMGLNKSGLVRCLGSEQQVFAIIDGSCFGGLSTAAQRWPRLLSSGTMCPFFGERLPLNTTQAKWPSLWDKSTKGPKRSPFKKLKLVSL